MRLQNPPEATFPISLIRTRTFMTGGGKNDTTIENFAYVFIRQSLRERSIKSRYQVKKQLEI